MNRIKEVIREKGLRGNYICEKTGISTTDLSSYIAERRKPSHEKLILLCRAIGCSIKDIYPDATKTIKYNLFGEK
jgi:transcriptional regulator with XRE-family HTH domain|tara:strand:- start:241 stop:465 length:225 start_codon:yes stop_codon:yes gene_type:complete